VTGGRLLAAFVWLHWRQQVNALNGRRRGVGAKLGAWVQVAVRALLALALLGLTVACSAGLAAAGVALAAGEQGADVAVLALRLGLGFLGGLTVLLAALRAGLTGTGGLERLLLLPLSRRGLHRLASVSFLADPWLLALFPGLLVLAGMLAGRGVVAVALALAAGLFFLLAVGAVSSAVARAVCLLFRNRRRAEAVLAGALLVLMLGSMAPGVFLARRGAAGGAPAPVRGEPAPQVAEAVRSFPWLLQAVPSEAYTRTVVRAAGGEPAAALPSLAALALVAAAAWTLSRRIWERLAGSPATGGRRGRARLPGWRGAAGAGAVPWAVAGTLARISLRTVQGKIAMIAPTVAALALSVMGEAGAGPFAGWMQGPTVLIGITFVALTVNQNVLLNQFGADRGGLTLELLSPMTPRQLLLGRALGGAVLTAMAFAPALLAAVLTGAVPSPAVLAAPLLGLAGAYALYFPIAAWLSLLFPKPADLGKLSQEGKPQPAAILLGLLGLVVVLAVAGGIGLAGAAAAGPAGAVVAEALFAAVALLLFPALLAWTAAGLELRREAVYLAVRGS
jgi:hypothetical protein